MAALREENEHLASRFHKAKEQLRVRLCKSAQLAPWRVLASAVDQLLFLGHLELGLLLARLLAGPDFVCVDASALS